VEEEVLNVQRGKRRLVGLAFGEDVKKRGERVRGERLRDIERLLR